MTYNNKIDVDAAAFIAKGITNATHQKAVNYLCVELKKANLWNKMVAVYPFVGGTAALHAWNLRNLSQHNIVWQSSPQDMTHNSTGVTPNTSTGNLMLSGASLPSQSLFHLSYYISASIGAGNVYSFGAGAPQSTLAMELGIFSSQMTFRFGGVGDSCKRFNSERTGFFLVGLNSNTLGYIYINGTQLAATSFTSYRRIENASLVMNSRAGSAHGVNNDQYSFCSVGTSLTDDERLILNNIVQQYQTMLGRAV